MIESLQELRFLSKYLGLVVLIFGCIAYKNYSNTNAKYFIYSIIFAISIEFLGANFYKLFGIVNYPVYNFFTIVQITFFMWWLQYILESSRFKLMIKIFIVSYLLFAIGNTIYGQSFMSGNQTVTYIVGVIFLLMAICFYYLETFNKESILSITDSTNFWFILGVLLFYGTFMPFMIASDLFLNGDQRISSPVTFLLNLIMYSCFAVGFYKSYKKVDKDLY